MWSERLRVSAKPLPASSCVIRLLRRLYPRLRSVAAPLAAVVCAAWVTRCAYGWTRLRLARTPSCGTAGDFSARDPQSSARAGDGSDEGDGDDFGFVDAAVSAYRAFRRRVERLHEAPLLRAIGELEADGARWRGLRARRPGGERSDAEALEERQLRARVQQRAHEADERLTQLLVQLDLAPVGDSAALRQERKAAIVDASALADRIAVWTHLSPDREEGSLNGGEHL